MHAGCFNRIGALPAILSAFPNLRNLIPVTAVQELDEAETEVEADYTNDYLRWEG
jgi:hypothetical protein